MQTTAKRVSAGVAVAVVVLAALLALRHLGLSSTPEGAARAYASSAVSKAHGALRLESLAVTEADASRATARVQWRKPDRITAQLVILRHITSWGGLRQGWEVVEDGSSPAAGTAWG